MIPLMTSRLGLGQHAAHGTSLFAVATTGIAGALAYGMDWSWTSSDGAADAEDPHADAEDTNANTTSPRLVELDVAFAIAAAGTVTARLGAATTTMLSERALRTALGIFMLCVAPLVPAKAYLEDWREGQARDEGHTNSTLQVDTASTTANFAAAFINTEKLLPAAIIGCFSGYLAGLFGVGGGAVVVPALTVGMPSEHSLSHRAALGTSLCAMVPPALAGTYAHHLRGNVDKRVAPALAIGSACGAYLGGTTLGRELDEVYLRWGFSGLMLFLGVKTLAKR